MMAFRKNGRVLGLCARKLYQRDVSNPKQKIIETGICIAFMYFDVNGDINPLENYPRKGLCQDDRKTTHNRSMGQGNLTPASEY